jgi:hypothetical protein
MIMPSRLPRSYVASFLFVSLLELGSHPVQADVSTLSDDQLFDRGKAAYDQENFVDALMYLSAYQAQAPQLMREVPEFARELEEAIRFSYERLRDLEKELSEARERLASQSPGERQIFRPVPPPPLSKPPASVQEGPVPGGQIGPSPGLQRRFPFFCYDDRPEGRVCSSIGSVRSRDFDEAKAQAGQMCQRRGFLRTGIFVSSKQAHSDRQRNCVRTAERVGR